MSDDWGNKFFEDMNLSKGSKEKSMNKPPVSTLTGDRLAYWVASALAKRCITLDGVAYREDGTVASVGSHYRPHEDGGQCFELAKLFNLVVNFEKMNAYHPDYLHSDFTDRKSIEAAICRAVIASVFGEFVNEEEG